MPGSRRHLTPQELLAAAEALQVALLDGIVRARRWGKSELAFQGGTSLHLAYGSPRASEDLDFIVASDKGLAAVMEAAVVNARAYVRQVTGPDAALQMKTRGAAPGTGKERNPRVFTVAFTTPAFLEAVRVRAEFYVTEPAVAAEYASQLRVARLTSDAALRRPLRLAISQAIVPTAQLTEIFADKLYAVGARKYLKYRDVFDLWWLDQQGAALAGGELVQALEHRHALYPNGPAVGEELAGALRARAAQISSESGSRALSRDLSRWLALTGDRLLSAPPHCRSIAQAAAGHVLAAADTIAARARPAPRRRVARSR